MRCGIAHVIRLPLPSNSAGSVQTFTFSTIICRSGFRVRKRYPPCAIFKLHLIILQSINTTFSESYRNIDLAFIETYMLPVNKLLVNLRLFMLFHSCSLQSWSATQLSLEGIRGPCPRILTDPLGSSHF